MSGNKYHIGKSGKVSVCRAKKSCPLGLPTEHFNSIEEAQQYSDNIHEAVETFEKDFKAFANSDKDGQALAKLANSSSHISRMKAIDFGYRDDTLIDDPNPRVRLHLAEKGLYLDKLQNDLDETVANTAKENLKSITVEKEEDTGPTQLKRADAKKELLSKGFIKIKGQYNSGYFKLIQANEETLGQNTEKLIEQLKSEGKYNSWIGVYNFRTNSENDPVDIDRLPVYGNPNRYETKWFCQDKNKAVTDSLRTLKQMGVLIK